MATISISQLDTATQAKVDDLYEVAVVDANSQTGYASRKLTAAQIATLIAQGVQFSGLSTEAKTIIASINEAAQNGGTEVEANPAGESTDTLKKIGIDGTIYEVGGSSEPVSKTAKGNPINITDAADAPIVSGTVTFEPVQDLHGYDKPWAGGVGVNLFNCAISGGSASSLNITFTNTYDSDGNVLGVKSSGTSTGYAQLNIDVTLPAGTYKTNVTGFDGSKMDMNIRTTSGWLANPNAAFTLNAETTVIIRYFVTEGNQGGNTILCSLYKYNGTDYPFEPYSNICPIEGYTDCEVEVTGKNLCPYTESGSISNSGADVANDTYARTPYIAVNEGVEYTFSVNPLQGKNINISINVFSQKDTNIIAELPLSTNSKSFVMPTGGNYIRVVLFTTDRVSPAISYFEKPQLELGSTATSYEPYQSTTYTIDLDGTRYGGKVYPVTGKISVGMGHIASYNGETIGEPWLSDRDEYVAGTTPTTGAEVVYNLASPVIVQLTPEQIQTLEGTNNISTNMTGMSLEYITQDYQPLVELIERSAGHHYSEQERVVGTYFGKPLYERSYNVTTPDTINTVHQIIEVPANSKIVNIFGMYDNQFPLNFYYDVDNRIETWLNNAKTHVVNRTPYNLMLNLPGIVTLQYTKTTD